MGEKRQKFLFYGIVTAATIIVATAGATFAFFTASASNAAINGTAASAGLTLTVTQNAGGNNPLVPLSDTALANAIAGTGGTAACVDNNGNTSCKVYTVTVTNTGSSAAMVNGTITFTGAGYTNLKWAKLTTATTVQSPVYNPAVTHSPVTAVTNLTGTSKKLEASNASNTDVAVYYVAVWISETGSAQSDSGTFTGTITFNSASGGGVTSTFSA